MNRYEKIYKNQSYSLTKNELLNLADNFTNWEDGYWLAKILQSNEYGITDEALIQIYEHCLFAGLTRSKGDVFYEVVALLSKLYLRYENYDYAESHLRNLTLNPSCPDWAHLYLGQIQIYKQLERIAEDPQFFFARLEKVNIENGDSLRNLKIIFGKYVCEIVNSGIKKEIVASDEIVRFAEKLKMTSSDEFKYFHQNICPNKVFKVSSKQVHTLSSIQAYPDRPVVNENIEASRKEEGDRLRKERDQAIKDLHLADQRISKLEQENAVLVNNYDKVCSSYNAERIRLLKEIKKANADLNYERECVKDLEKQKVAGEASMEEELIAQQKYIAALEKENEENRAARSRIQELEAQQTKKLPESIDDIQTVIITWINQPIKRDLAKWLKNRFRDNSNYWMDYVRPALKEYDLDAFDNKTDLSEFSFDALMNIYLKNYKRCHPLSDRDRASRLVKDMKKVRNKWSHFEDKGWTKKLILQDLDVIVRFAIQIQMPEERRKEYMEYRAYVDKAVIKL